MRRTQRLLVAMMSLSLLMLASRASAFGVPAAVKEVVTFVFVKDAHGTLTPAGTAFFVGVPAETRAGKEFVYLVTAAHVVRDQKGQLFPKVWLRVNRRGGPADFLELELATLAKDCVLVPRDPSVDLIAIHWSPDTATYDHKHLHTEVLAEKESPAWLAVTEGAEAFFTGLFTSYFGQKRNVPIVRFGRIALMPTERIPAGMKPDGTEDLRELFLLEAQAFAGNSGSPVFVLAGDRLLLGGVLSCTFMNLQSIHVSQTSEAHTHALSTSGLGIAGIVPGHLLEELLTGLDAQKQRAGFAERLVPIAPH